MIPKEKFENALHVTLLVDEKSFAKGSALYTFLLTQHKKVSLVSKEKKLSLKFSFLPWYDKVRTKIPSSSDFIYDVSLSVEVLYSFFQENNYKINKKMAEALYSALLCEFDFFRSSKVDGTVFALASELIALGAEHTKAREYLFFSKSLSSFRIASILAQNMQLKENATCAEVTITTQELEMCGATLQECVDWMYECLHVVHVTQVSLLKKDENNKIIKTIKDI